MRFTWTPNHRMLPVSIWDLRPVSTDSLNPNQSGRSRLACFVSLSFFEFNANWNNQNWNVIYNHILNLNWVLFWTGSLTNQTRTAKLKAAQKSVGLTNLTTKRPISNHFNGFILSWRGFSKINRRSTNQLLIISN